MTFTTPEPREDPDLDLWVSTGDLDELLREVGRRCDRADWDGVVLLRDRARAATQRGHQLWPAATFAEYRLALAAPPQWAAAVVEAGYMATGPLTEVAAQHHTFADLSAELPPGPARAQVAHERVLRGEVVDDGELGGLPGRLLAWEPGYELAEYLPSGEARFPSPPPVRLTDPLSGRVLERGAHLVAEDATGARALSDAVIHWRTASDGLVRSIGVEGRAGDAVTTLLASQHDGTHGASMPARCSEVGLADAVALLAWAAASGGARGRRRGAATGRFEAWWVLAALTATDDQWPTDPGPVAEELRWWVWSPSSRPGASEPGWVCRLAVEDPVDGLAWAIDATDRMQPVDR